MKKTILAAVALAATMTVQAEVTHDYECYGWFGAVSTITVTDEDTAEYQMAFDGDLLITPIVSDTDEALTIDLGDKGMKLRLGKTDGISYFIPDTSGTIIPTDCKPIKQGGN